MKANEILVAMHLLLANKVFSPTNLKQLLSDGTYNPDTPLMQQLKAMHDAYVDEGKLVSNTMLAQFPDVINVTSGEVQLEMDSVQFAEMLEKSIEDTYCVHEVASNLGQLICFAYNLNGYDEEAINDAIEEANPEILRELSDDIKNIDWMVFIEKSYKFADAFIKELNYIKRNEHNEVVDPGYIFRTQQEFDHGRAIRAASYARYSLNSLGQFLAILYPIMLIILADTDPETADFIDFIYDARLIEIIEHYCCEARIQYGEPTSVNVLRAMMEDDIDKFYDPDDEPEDDECHSALGDFKDTLPQVTRILYDEFYTE